MTFLAGAVFVILPLVAFFTGSFITYKNIYQAYDSAYGDGSFVEMMKEIGLQE